jgi:hypothetical protein
MIGIAISPIIGAIAAPEIQVISSQRKGIKPRDTILNRSWR